MSYDIEVFSVERPIVEPPPNGPDWQIVVDGPARVEPEDIPGDGRTALPGLRFLTRLHLEGDASASARTTLITLGRAVARDARGVIVDQQTGTVETPRGVQRLTASAEPTGDPILQLSWFVHDVNPLITAAPGALLELFQHSVPELMPRRYGLHEPARFKIESEGHAHFTTFLQQHLREPFVWTCHKPCRDVFIAIPERVGPTSRGFRCGRLTIAIDGAAAGDRAWRVELTRLWLAVSDLVRPFYAEIRSGECPTKSWWWNGIPAAAPAALLIGEPYIRLWPEFGAAARTTRTGLAYRERFSPVEATSATNDVPSPPARLAQPVDRSEPIAFDPLASGSLTALLQQKIRYPDVWPFEGPLSEG